MLGRGSVAVGASDKGWFGQRAVVIESSPECLSPYIVSISELLAVTVYHNHTDPNTRFIPFRESFNFLLEINQRYICGTSAQSIQNCHKCFYSGCQFTLTHIANDLEILGIIVLQVRAPCRVVVSFDMCLHVFQASVTSNGHIQGIPSILSSTLESHFRKEALNVRR